jgi:TonB-linked SusC/RagA family outer membrane protein
MKKFFTLTLLLLVVMQAIAQERTISGRVIALGDGALLPGVNVVAKGTTVGTVTDIEGRYLLQVPPGSNTLVFSYVGYVRQEVAIPAGSSQLDVTLSEDVSNLEEVVVTGLASSIKRSNLANAVSTVSARELVGTTQPQTLDNALYGKLTGANINASGGAPGGGISVQLRGISTLGGGNSQPLYIIDGVYISNTNVRSGRANISGAAAGSGAAAQDDSPNRLADINPDDIETIEVLKGSSAAAIYGTRANAGVIIITTKKGTAGKTRISFGQDLGFSQAQRFLGQASWDEAKQSIIWGNNPARLALEQERFRAAQGRVYDYEREFYGETGIISNSRLSISGGNDKTRFFVGGNLRNETGIIKNTGFERNNLRANIDHKLNDFIDISVNSAYMYTNTDRGFTGNQNNTGASIGYTLAYVPSYFSLYPDEQGVYPRNPYGGENPLALRDKATNNSSVNRFIQSANVNAFLYRGSNSFLKLNIQGGYDFFTSNVFLHLPTDLQFQSAQINPGDVVHGKQDNMNMNVQAFLIYNTNVGRVNFNSQVGTVRLDYRMHNLMNRSRGLVAGETNLLQGKLQEILDHRFERVTDVGVVAQEEINFDDKIIGTLGIRFDKSSLNGNANRFYAFPKASLAINVANFDFWTIRNTVNQFKPRIAYGETGGLPTFGNTFTSLVPVNIDGQLGTAHPAVIGNPDIRPERATELEMGADFGFFNNRITLEATYYNKSIYDLILSRNTAPASGVNSQAGNFADLRNRGVELALGATPVQNRNFRWHTRAMYWHNRAQITNLEIPAFLSGGFGAALGTFWYREGISPTTIVGTPQISPGIFTTYGDAQPDFQMSFFNEINFLRSFDFSMLWHWKQGGDNINLTKFLTDGGGTTADWNVPTINPTTGVEGPTGRNRPANASPWIEDASYVRLREIGLYYTVPEGLTSSVFRNYVNKIRLGVSGNNILTFTNYSGYDPETSTFGAHPVQSGIDIAPFPTSKRMMFHIQIDL